MMTHPFPPASFPPVSARARLREPLGVALCWLALVGSAAGCNASGDDGSSPTVANATNDAPARTAPGSVASPGAEAPSDTTNPGRTNTVPPNAEPIGSAAADDVSIDAVGSATSGAGLGESAADTSRGPDAGASGDAGAAEDAGESVADAGSLGDAGAADAGAPAADTLDDGQIVGVVDALNAGEVEQAQAALPRLQLDAVRAFAQIMIEEHQAARGNLGTLATEQQLTLEGSELADQLRERNQQVLATLAAAGVTQIDGAYLDSQITAHAEADTVLASLVAAADSEPLAARLTELRLNVQGHGVSARALQSSLLGGAAP